MPNRHERRRAAAKRFAVAIEIIRERDLGEHIRRHAPFGAAVFRMAEAMDSTRPSTCAACRNLLTPSEPPRAFVVFRRLDTGAETLAGACVICSEAADLVPRVAAVAGVSLKPVSPRWGHA
jgi:hypothetical protein